MPEGPTKLQRWLDLIAYLVPRRLPVAVEDLMEGIPAYARRWQSGDDRARATARRTFERDKDELRRAGIPIRTVRYTIGFGHEEIEGYRLERRDFYLPYVRLVAGKRTGAGRVGDHGIAKFEVREAEMDLAVQALQRLVDVPSFPFVAEARSALRKLTFDLAREPGEATPLYLERADRAELRGVVRDLSDALLQRKRVRFNYHGLYRDEETERDVSPYGLLFQHGHWYLIGQDATRDAVRVFRVGRMHDVSHNTSAPNTPDYEVPADFHLERHVGRRAWELHGEEETPLIALVLFRFPLSLWAERAGHGRLVEPHDDGGAVRAFEVRQVAPFLRWLLSFETEAEVLDPPELRKAVREMAQRVAAAHRESETSDA
jgi:proteasome accessory factor B